MTDEQLQTQLDEIDGQISRLMESRRGLSQQHQNRLTDETRTKLRAALERATVEGGFGDGMEAEYAQVGAWMIGSEEMSDMELFKTAEESIWAEGYTELLATARQELGYEPVDLGRTSGQATEAG